MKIKIKKFLKKFLKQNGQVAVLIGFMLVALVGLLAYVVDEGVIYESRASFQSVADSAALAGAQELPDDPGAAEQTAIDYAAMHEVPSEELTITIEDTFVTDDTIRVVSADPAKPLNFGGIFGMDSTPVGADATAVIGSPPVFNNIVPFGILEDDWVPGEEYTLKWGPHGGPGAPGGGGGAQQGNFGALALGGTGANNYRNNIREGYSGTLQVGDVIETEPGNMKGPTIQGTNDRINNYPDYTFNTFEELTTVDANGNYVLTDNNDSQFIMCPLINEIPNGRGEVTILAFIPFIITGVSGSEVYGTFIDEALIITDGDIAALDSHGIRIIRLID